VDPGNGPGNPGILTASTADFSSGGNYNAVINGSGPAGAPDGYSQLALTGSFFFPSLTLGGYVDVYR